ncbi:MAG: ribonuclease R, partial [Bacilli bacterium]|nr:ribonuclease R [Bacilli bacterium]
IVEIDIFTNHGEVEGKVIRILKRDIKDVVGEMVLFKKKLVFKPDDSKLDVIISLTRESTKHLVEGHKVLVRVVKDFGNNHYLGEILKVLGHKNDPGVDIISIALRHGIEIEFNESVLQELEHIPAEVMESDLKNRRDLTGEMIFTIDGDDTKDIDDAISLKKEGAYYCLGVHIADVSYYVKTGTALYESAFMRGTSSYLADTVIPMIPHQLSNGICSLNPEVVRLTISCEMKINSKGIVEDYDIFPSFIKSRKQMTYKNVNKVLMDNIVPEGYEEYADTLRLMNELAGILRKEKISRGYIDFGLDEAKVVQDENGKAIDIVKRLRGDGENLIEDFMIVANETVATHVSNMDLPFVYRVHDIPSSEKIEDFTNLVKQMGYKLNTDLRKLTPLTMQSILNELHNKPEFTILSDMLLRSMKKAKYSTNNIGHFGLASENYAHFTSPIRRFPDLTVHRLLRTYFFENDMSMDTINFNQKYLIDVSENSSATEVAAQEAERDVLDMKMAEYMEDRIGEIYQGTINSVTSFGFFVTLENLVEGLVHISTLKGYYNYVAELLSLIKDDNSKRYRIGDVVTIRVIGASKENGTIDFEVVQGEKDGNQE